MIFEHFFLDDPILFPETEVEVPWTATMYVTGHEAIWLEQQCRNHWLWFVGIDQLAPYDQRLIAGKTPFGQGLRYVKMDVRKRTLINDQIKKNKSFFATMAF